MANISNTNSEVDSTTFNEYKAGILIWKIIPPILIILGTVGNSLSILVLTRRSIRTSTTALFLTVLAFSDLVVLYSGLLRQWLIYLFDTDVRKVSQFGCKLNIWLVYNSLDFSAWILIVVTLERVISAWLPHRARTLCTKKIAIALLVSVGVFILGLNAHLLYGMVFKTSPDENDTLKCVEVNDDYYHFFNVTWPWIDFCAFCLIPFTVIVIGNSLILFKVLKSQRKVKSRVVPSVQTGSRQPVASRHGNKQSSMTAMLFTLNVVFLISTSPISIYNIGYPHWEKGASPHEIAQLDMWWAIVNMLMYVNNSLNFLLYCLSGTKFRLEVIRIFCSWKHRTTQTAAQSNYTRTKFDTPSPSPTPRNSALFSVNTPFSNSNNQIDINVKHNESANQNGTTTFRHSNNSLHPNDALKIANCIHTGNAVTTDAHQADASNSGTSEMVPLGNLNSEGMEKNRAIYKDKTDRMFENKSDDTDNGINDALDEHDSDVKRVNAECIVEDLQTADVESVTSQSGNIATVVEKINTLSGNLDKDSKGMTKDSTV